MTDTLTLTLANKIIAAVFSAAKQRRLNPLAVMVLDAHGNERAFQAEDGASPLRPKIAHGKAFGAVGLGIGSRAIMKRAEQQAFFVNAVNALADGAVVPVPGGVLIRNEQGDIIGAVGVTGDTSDNDEAVAISGIEEAGLKADAG